MTCGVSGVDVRRPDADRAVLTDRPRVPEAASVRQPGGHPVHPAEPAAARARLARRVQGTASGSERVRHNSRDTPVKTGFNTGVNRI